MEGKVVDVVDAAGLWTVEFQNGIDENLDYPEIPQGVKRIAVDLGQVTFLNSSGIRDWIRWIRPVVAAVGAGQVSLSRLPLSFIRAANLVKEVLPEGLKVTSFFVNYFCTKCDDDRVLLFENKDVRLEGQICAVCQSALELEISTKSYDCVMKLA